MQIKNGAVIIYDAAYEAYITEEDVPHSIYECEGARTCAIELRSFSKNAGFTGVRLGFTVVPKDLVREGVALHDLWARRHGTKFNGAPYIVQRAGEAVYSQEGKAQLKEQVAYYMRNAHTIYNGLKEAGYSVSGGVNAPYIWLKTPNNMSSWDFFDYLLKTCTCCRNSGIRIRSTRRRLLPSDRIRNLRKYLRSDPQDHSFIKIYLGKLAAGCRNGTLFFA